MKLWRVQKFFGDVVYDLRNRGLLPVALLLVVAMVAVPVLISHGSHSSPPPISPAASSIKPSPQGETAVVSYSPPGIRNYKRRLNELSAKDPFRQQFAPPPVAGKASQLNSTVAPSTPSASPTSSPGGTGSSSTVSSGPAPSSDSGSRTTTHRLFLIHSVADISVGSTDQPLVRHKHIAPFSSLPGDASPVMIYLGSTLNGKRAIFSLSRSADQVTGGGNCDPSPTDCSLLSVKAGQSEDMLYALDGKTYRVKVNKITRVSSRVG